MRDVRDLVCWQLSHALESEILALTESGAASKDFTFCDRIRESAVSTPANIAAGFRHCRPAQFARFLGYAVASIGETENHLRDALDRGVVTDTLYSRLTNLVAAARHATINLMVSKQRQAALERQRQQRNAPRASRFAKRGPLG
jgi:four helix bundle protein